ncbi:MAG: hypothetical protein K1X56_12155 [Flavobacteriales bacterium]|nr:hypothetical protein [Flavobacteriales bacterium]
MSTKTNISPSIIASEKLSFCELSLRDDGIFLINVFPMVNLGREEMVQMQEAKVRITNNTKYVNLIIMQKYSSADHEARDYVGTEEAMALRIADAFVITSLPQRIVGNFYLNFNKPKVPTRFFTSEEEAEKWLRQFIK